MVKGDQVWLHVQRQQGCHNCDLSEGCGTGSLGKLMGHRNTEWVFTNYLNLKSGDRVVLGIPDKSYLLGTVLIYLMPLFMLFICAAIAEYFWHTEWITVVLSLSGLSSGILISSRLARVKYSDTLQAKILRQIW